LVVVVAGVIIGYVASVSYRQFPYTVNVSAPTRRRREGGRNDRRPCRLQRLVYQRCPDPGRRPVYDCHAPPEMKMARVVSLQPRVRPGHFQVSLRNGENYTLTGYMAFRNGTFDKACFETVVLSPVTQQQDVTRDLSC